MPTTLSVVTSKKKSAPTKMILISHRGNLFGKDPVEENKPETIVAVINLGYDVEIDVWLVNDKWFLGHDAPTYEFTLEWLSYYKKNVWVHCKNLEALVALKNSGLHYFWHENDTVTLTSKGIIWAYPGFQPIEGSIAVMPEIHNDDTSQCLGICSDIIGEYKKLKSL